MKTVIEVKNFVAKEAGYCDWSELLKDNLIDRIDLYFDKVAELYFAQRKESPGIIAVIGSGRNHSKLLIAAEQLALVTEKSISSVILDIERAISMLHRQNVSVPIIDSFERFNTAAAKLSLEPPRSVIPGKYMPSKNKFKKR